MAAQRKIWFLPSPPFELERTDVQTSSHGNKCMRYLINEQNNSMIVAYSQIVDWGITGIKFLSKSQTCPLYSTNYIGYGKINVIKECKTCGTLIRIVCTLYPILYSLV